MRSAPIRRAGRSMRRDSALAGTARAEILRLTPRVARSFGPLLLFLLCPVLDALARSPSRERLANSYLIEEATMERYWDYYRAEGLSSDDPRIAPRRESDFSCLPPNAYSRRRIRPLARRRRELRAIVDRRGRTRPARRACRAHSSLLWIGWRHSRRSDRVPRHRRGFARSAVERVSTRALSGRAPDRSPLRQHRGAETMAPMNLPRGGRFSGLHDFHGIMNSIAENHVSWRNLAEFDIKWSAVFGEA